MDEEELTPAMLFETMQSISQTEGLLEHIKEKVDEDTCNLMKFIVENGFDTIAMSCLTQIKLHFDTVYKIQVMLMDVMKDELLRREGEMIKGERQ